MKANFMWVKGTTVEAKSEQKKQIYITAPTEPALVF